MVDSRFNFLFERKRLDDGFLKVIKTINLDTVMSTEANNLKIVKQRPIESLLAVYLMFVAS